MSEVFIMLFVHYFVGALIFVRTQDFYDNFVARYVFSCYTIFTFVAVDTNYVQYTEYIAIYIILCIVL